MPPAWRRALVLLIALVVQLPAVSVHADTDPAVLKRARRYYKEGKAAFELGKFRRALQHYEEAYKIASLPGLLFNIGQCYRNVGEYEKAMFSFRLYLRKVPDARNRDAVRTLIGDLGRKIEDQREEAEQRRLNEERLRREEERRRQEEEQRRGGGSRSAFYKKWWFWTIVGVAVAGGVGAGVYFGTRDTGPSLPGSPFPAWELP